MPTRSASRGSFMSRTNTGRAIEYAARGGYTIKGFVYGTVGILAFMTALGFGGGRIVGTRSAIESLRSQPFGQALLWTIVVGLIGYVVWRFVQAITDPEHKGSDLKGLAQRTGLIVSGLTYAVLSFTTLTLLVDGFGRSSSGGGDGSQQSAGILMRYEGGIWIVAAIGVVFIGVGCFQAYRAYAISFSDAWKLDEMGVDTHKWSIRISRFGIAARAVAFGLIGWFFIRAALQADPNEARGLAGAMRSFYDEPFGAVWLGLIGLGFVCYGVYCVLNARFRRIDP